VLFLVIAMSGSSFVVAHASPSVPVAPVEMPILDTSEVELPSSTGLSDDVAAIVDAAGDYEAGDAEAAVELAEAASAVDGVELEQIGEKLVAETDTGEVVIEGDGSISLHADGMPDIGVQVLGDAEDAQVVDGALVQNEIAPSTDVVTRATEDGVQMVAILGDEDAPNEIEFAMELPGSARLVEQLDGSIAILADTEVETIAPAEAERVLAQIVSVLGLEYDGLAELTPEQEERIVEIPSPEITTVIQSQQIGLIDIPWAVDADGDSVDTHYEITDDGILQVVDFDKDTAFPVTVDPWWSWLVASAQRMFALSNPIGISNYSFAVKLGAWVAAITLATKGKCRYERDWPLQVCWGGKLAMLDGYGGGTTYGTTYYASKDPLTFSGMKSSNGKPTQKYKDLLQHEWVHTLQWKSLGLGMAGAYLVSEGIGRGLLTGGKAGCGNIFEIMAGLKKGGYTNC
jgi:hypothetical protein